MNKKSPYKNKDGVQVPRCTQIIDILGFNKAALIGWAKKFGQKATEISNKSLEIGTLTHKLIEAHIKNTEPPDLSACSFDAITLATNGFDMYQEWEQSNGVDYLECEYKIISEAYVWGGTADAIINMGGKTYLVDFKTAKGIYADHVVQVAAYLNGIKEEGKYNPEGVIIIHIPKTIEYKESMHVEPIEVPEEVLNDGWKAFLHARSLYDLKDKVDPYIWRHKK